MKQKRVAIGVDIGGTKIGTGIVDGEGRVYASPRTIATCANEPGEVIMANLLSLLKETLADAADCDVQGIGIGCTGPLDTKRGLILDVENLPTLNYYPLKETVERELSLPVVVENDANAMILGEAVWGAGKEARSVLGFTLGTGIGCALVNEGKIWRGHANCAGEIWTSPYKESILENYVSGNAVTRLYKEYTQEEWPAHHIAALARNGDEVALRVWDIFAEALAYALSWTVNTIDPELIVMGGSVLKSADLYWNKVNHLFRQYICQSVSKNMTLHPAMLGDNAGFIGAAALILKQ